MSNENTSTIGRSMYSKILQKTKTFLGSEDGPTTVEYAVMLAMIVGMMISAIVYVGNQANAVATDVVDGMDDALANN